MHRSAGSESLIVGEGYKPAPGDVCSLDCYARVCILNVMADQDDTLKQINKSGFPFQLRVEHEIRRTQQEHNWSVASCEHPWTSGDAKSSGFIDIVLSHIQFVTFRLVIECKRFCRVSLNPGTKPFNSCFHLPPSAVSSCCSSHCNVRSVLYPL